MRTINRIHKFFVAPQEVGEPVCRIVGAGVFDLPCIEPRENDLLIAADGGFIHLRRIGLTPDLLIGDFDSLDHLPQGIPIQRFLAEKDDTDMSLAVREGLERGFRYFALYGGMGGRLSHTLANIALLARLAQNGAQGFLVGVSAELTAIHNGGVAYRSAEAGLLSIFAFGDRATGVQIRGLKYELINGELTGAFPLGVSNAFCGRPASVDVFEGTLVMVREV
jgi:thiamine pyrophosphokinase